jgi:hypothetical protein
MGRSSGHNSRRRELAHPAPKKPIQTKDDCNIVSSWLDRVNVNVMKARPNQIHNGEI